MIAYSIVPPRAGVNYKWANDHTFVKVAGTDTNGAYALLEDNLEAEFSLGLHEHHSHAETFYILEGNVMFFLNGGWVTAKPGTTIHVPPGVPHAAKMEQGSTGRMLMIFQPAGFEQYLAELKAMSPEQGADVQLQNDLAARYDIHNLAGVPE